MPCGTILRQALQYDTIAAVILYDESQPGEKAVQLSTVDVGKKQTGKGIFWNFFQWINKGSFEISADAFTTFRVRSLLKMILDLLTSTGTSDKAQEPGLSIPGDQLQHVLHTILQPHITSLTVLRHKTTVYQAARRATPRQIQLCGYDPICSIRRQSQDDHEPSQGRSKDGSV